MSPNILVALATTKFCTGVKLSDSTRHITNRENTNSRLFVIDAGLDAHALRQQLPGPHALHAAARHRCGPASATAAPASRRQTGYVARVGSGPIHVPHALRAPLESLNNLYQYHNIELNGCVYWDEAFNIVAVEKDGIVLCKGL